MWEQHDTIISLETSILKSFRLIIQPTIRWSPGAGSGSEQEIHTS